MYYTMHLPYNSPPHSSYVHVHSVPTFSHSSAHPLVLTPSVVMLCRCSMTDDGHCLMLWKHSRAPISLNCNVMIEYNYTTSIVHS